MTKAAICVDCLDLVAPFRDWETDRRWRWCQCGHAGTRWVDGVKGQLEVTARNGRDAVRVLGLANNFLVPALSSVASVGPKGWQDLHDLVTLNTEGYLFHRSSRSCWAVLARVGQTNDVRFTDYADAQTGTARSPA